MPITARGEIVGPVGGYGWILELNGGAPRTLLIQDIEVLPETPLLVSIAYPNGTTFNVTMHAPSWCWKGSTTFSCSEIFSKVGSLEQVRNGPGNEFFVDSNGVLTFRVVQTPSGYIGRPKWFIPNRTDSGLNGIGFALDRFERSGVFLPRSSNSHMRIEATCGGSGPYCSAPRVLASYEPTVCASGYQQVAYDSCCSLSDTNACVYASQLL